MNKNILIEKLQSNEGQIEGLPKNPRFIKDSRFEALKKSIEDAPEMLAYRTLLVYPHEGNFIVLCGNMRLKACTELGYKEMPCYVLPKETPVEKLREYTIKDNIGFGANDWEILSEDWNIEELKDWGMEVVDETEWEKLQDIEEEVEDPQLIKGKKIVLQVPPESEGLVDEIKKELKEFIEKFPGVEIL